MRVTTGGPSGLASSNVLTRAALLEAADAAASVVPTPAARSAGPVLAVRRIPPEQQSTRPAAEEPLQEKAAVTERAGEAAFAVDGRIRQVVVTYVDVSQHVLIADSDGRLTHDIRTRTRMTCRAVARDSDGSQAGFEGPGRGGGLELFEDHPPDQVGRAAAARAVRMLRGVPFSADDTVVVLGQAGGGLFLHEACGHGLEADGLARGSSVYAGTSGRRLASPEVTAIDDPTMAAGFGSYAVDDEGCRATATTLIDQGMQVGAMTDAATAGRLGVRPSANGRCESYSHPPLCRLSNTYLAPGPDRPDDVVGDVRSGLYVARLSGGQVDIATGDFAFSSSEAYLIENGELTRPVAGATIVGNGPRALAAIDAVGDDLAFTQALCGKSGQWVPVSYGSPTIRVPGLRVVPA